MVLTATNPFKSVEVETASGVLRIDEGMKITFAAETGEKISGTLTKISGKGEKTKNADYSLWSTERGDLEFGCDG